MLSMGLSSRIKALGLLAIILFFASTVLYSSPNIAETHLSTTLSDSFKKIQDGVASFSNPVAQYLPGQKFPVAAIIPGEDGISEPEEAAMQKENDLAASEIKDDKTPAVIEAGTHNDEPSLGKTFEAAAKAAEPTADTTHDTPLIAEPEDEAPNKTVSSEPTAAAQITTELIVEEPKVEPTEEQKKESEELAKQAKEREFESRKNKLIRDHEFRRNETIRELSKNETLREMFRVTPEDLGIILRTGSQVQGRLMGPLTTWAVNRTRDNLVIYSDQASTYMGYTVQDAIAPWVERPQIAHTEAAKFWHKLGGKQKREFGGWQLDALKYVSSVHLGYNELRKHRDFKWYVFVDDDSYYHLPTLAMLLSNLDYTDEFYVGGVSYFGIAFAHGGSGSIASAGTMKKRFVDNEDTVVKYHDIGATAQYGDTNLARAFEAVDIWFDHSFTTNFNGDGPYQRWLGRDMLCQHAVTFHHLPLEFFPIYHEAVKDLPVVTYLDVVTALTHPNAQDSSAMTDLLMKDDWTFNIHIEDVGTAVQAGNRRNDLWQYTVDKRHSDRLNPEKCQAACLADDNCIAWTYIASERTCAMSDWFKLGHSRSGSKSGMHVERLTQWSSSCLPQWPRYFD